MRRFTVIASNKHFFQKFGVVAADLQAAHDAVSSELARLADVVEVEEYTAAVQASADRLGEPRAVTRAEFAYVVGEQRTVDLGETSEGPSVRFVDWGGCG